MDSASTDAPTVPNDDVVDTLTHIDDAEDEPTDEGPSGIDSYSIDDLKRMIQFLPSDLRQFEYYGGGKWLGRCRKDESQTCLFAAGIVSTTVEPEAPEPEEGEEPLRHKKRKHKMHSYALEHSGKIWRPHENPDSGVSTA